LKVQKSSRLFKNQKPRKSQCGFQQSECIKNKRKVQYLGYEKNMMNCRTEFMLLCSE